MAKRKEEVDELEQAANDRDAKELETPEPKVRVSDAKDDDEEFEVSADDDDDDDEPTPERPTRKDKRKQRGDNLVREANERAQRAEEAAAEQRALYAALINQNRQTIERLAPPPVERPDPERQRLESDYNTTYEQRQALVNEHARLTAANQMTPQLHQEMSVKDRDFNRKLTGLAVRLEAPPQQRGMSQQDLQAAVAVQRLNSEHADVMGNPHAAHYFRGAYMQLRAMGKPDEWETINLAAAKARELAGMQPKGGRPAPSRGTRAKFEGAPRSGGHGAGGGRATGRMTAELKKMAHALYGDPNKDENKRDQKFANEFGNDPDFKSA